MAFVKDLWYSTKKNESGHAKKKPTKRHGAGKRWLAVWNDADGEEKTRAFEKKDDAKDHISVMEADVLRGEYFDPDAGKTLFNSLAEGWLASQLIDPASFITYESKLRLHVLPTFSKKPVKNISPALIQKWLKELSDKYSVSLVTTCYNVLYGILELAISEKEIKANPLNSDLIKLPKSIAEKVIPWTDATLFGMINFHPDQYTLVPIIGAGCGLRQAEIFGLSPDDIDFENRILRVRRQIKKLGSDHIFALPKYEKEREVPLPRWVADAARSHIHTHKPQFHTLAWQKVGSKPRTVKLMFKWHTDGLPLRARLYSEQIWRPGLVAAGKAPQPSKDARGRRRYLNNRRDGMHALRHYYASVLLADGVSIRDLADYLGHSDPSFTFRTYVHMLPGSHDRAISAIDGRFLLAPSISDGTETEQPHLIAA